MLKEDCVWVTHASNTRISILTQGWQGAKWSECKEHDRPGAVEEGYAAFCEDERIMKRMRRGISDQHVVLCKVRLMETWIKRRKVVN